MSAKRAIVLVSGGLDSATCLAMAANSGLDIYALSFLYGQRHLSEIKAAKVLAKAYGAKEHKLVRLELDDIGGSSLTDLTMSVPEVVEDGVPNTYVPARNSFFLSIAMGWAEVIGASSIYIGVNAVDYSGYPDCRPEFIEAFQRLIPLATNLDTADAIKLETPLIHLSKAEIIKIGTDLGLDYSQTVSCYQADDKGAACGKCASCQLRQRGFKEAGLEDPTFYVA